MMVVDTSALMAIILRQAEAEACTRALEDAEGRVISAATLGEAFVVAGRRNVAEEMERLLDGLGMEVAPVDAAAARRVAAAYARWGKGVHPARLNLGDCFAYQEARARGCPLLYVGNDFARTDIESAI